MDLTELAALRQFVGRTQTVTDLLTPVPPTLLGMAARGALIYGASDTQVETSGAFVSRDQGQSWQPLLKFDAIQAIDPCVKTLCQDDCQLRAGLGQWSSDMCDAVPAPRATDGGVPAGDGGIDAAKPVADGGTVHPAVDAGAAPGGGSGCHCAAGGRAPGSPGAAVLAAAVLLFAFRRRGRGRCSTAVRHARAGAAPRQSDRLPLDDDGDGLDEIVGLDRLG